MRLCWMHPCNCLYVSRAQTQLRAFCPREAFLLTTSLHKLSSHDAGKKATIYFFAAIAIEAARTFLFCAFASDSTSHFSRKKVNKFGSRRSMREGGSARSCAERRPRQSHLRMVGCSEAPFLAQVRPAAHQHTFFVN